MFPLDLEKLTPEQRAMVALWEEHLKAEFQDKDARASCDTMVARPYVNHVPVLTGGVGRLGWRPWGGLHRTVGFSFGLPKAGGLRMRDSQPTHLDPRAPLVLDTRDLPRSPGAMREVERVVPAPEDLGLVLIRVPVGTDVSLSLRLESVSEGVWVSAWLRRR